ncbi:MAG: LodA/GoxA family CTQ-dependent oxidase [Reyranellaceae bacterium]
MDRRDLLKAAATTTLIAAAARSPAAEAQPARPEAPSAVTFRIHPAIGIARIGNSPAFYYAPETESGSLPDTGEALWGGLPLDPRSGDPVTAEDFRDADGRLKRQAVRFRLYAYTGAGYATGENHEIILGAVIGGRTVKDIRWSVHVANKKLNNYTMEGPPDVFPGIAAYQDGKLPAVRWPAKGPLEGEERLRTLVIDPGPRALSARFDAGRTIAFDRATPASCLDAKGAIAAVPDYPKSFPADHFDLDVPLRPLDSLGEIRTEAATGRLIFSPGYGNTVGIKIGGRVPSLEEASAAENDQWFDDVSDGPVSATIVFEDGSTAVAAGAWAHAGAPGFAPQTRNVVTAWDEVYDTFVRHLGLLPTLFEGGDFDPSYVASFDDDIRPVFAAVMLQRWNTNLPAAAVRAHDAIGAIEPADDPTRRIPNFAALIRNPAAPDQFATGSPLMPLALGDETKPFLTVTHTQYFLLRQWHRGRFTAASRTRLGPGEALDRIALANCLGGRFSPGIELSYPLRDPGLYEPDWRRSPGGPFRIRAAPLDYTTARRDKPFLGVGYVPLRGRPLEPGDLSKFMAVPWHTDYNHCAVHPLSPNPRDDSKLYWSWPAERPVMVHPHALARFDRESGWQPGPQLYAVRGDGTTSVYPANAGRFQAQRDFVRQWYKVGFVVQASRIDPRARPAAAADPFLEVACGFPASADQAVASWPSYNVPRAP